MVSIFLRVKNQHLEVRKASNDSLFLNREHLVDLALSVDTLVDFCICLIQPLLLVTWPWRNRFLLLLDYSETWRDKL